jgi:hypothetical protein
MSPFLPQAPSTYATVLRPCSPYSLPAIPAVSPCWECLEPPWFQHETSPFIHYQALKAFFLYSIMPTILLLPLQILTSQLFKWSPCGVHVWLSSVPCALSTDTQQQNYGESDLSSHIHSNEWMWSRNTEQLATMSECSKHVFCRAEGQEAIQSLLLAVWK